MTSSPGLRGWSRLQARHGVLQTPTDDDRRRQTPESKTILAPTLCVGGPVINFPKTTCNWLENFVIGQRTQITIITQWTDHFYALSYRLFLLPYTEKNCVWLTGRAVELFDHRTIDVDRVPGDGSYQSRRFLIDRLLVWDWRPRY